MRVFVIAMECEAGCVRPFLRPEDRLIVCGIGKVNAAAAQANAIVADANAQVEAAKAEIETLKEAAAAYRAAFLKLVEDQAAVLEASEI